MFRRIKLWWKRKEAKRFAKQYKKHREFLNTIRTTFINQLLAKEPIILEGITKQGIILYNNNRKTIAIFIRVDTYREILEHCITPKENINEIIETIKSLQEPVGIMGEIPIYLSSLMDDAPIFVAGGITWKLRKPE